MQHIDPSVQRFGSTHLAFPLTVIMPQTDSPYSDYTSDTVQDRRNPDCTPAPPTHNSESEPRQLSADTIQSPKPQRFRPSIRLRIVIRQNQGYSTATVHLIFDFVKSAKTGQKKKCQ